MASQLPPKKNTAYTTYVGLVSQANTKLFQVNPTLAAGDVKVSTDGGAFGNLTTLPVVTPAGGRAVKVDLSAGEMNGDTVVVQFVDAAGAEWCDLLLTLPTTTRQVDDLAFPAIAGRSLAVDAAGRTALASGLVKNAALAKFEFLMTDATAHNPVTGKVVTVTRSIDDGAFAAGTLSAVTEIAFGIYAVDFGAGDLNGTVITLRAVAAGCDDLFVTLVPDP